MSNKETEKKIEVRVTATNLFTDILGIITIIMLLDIVGCDWCHGFCRKCADAFKSQAQVSTQINPSDCR